ncbi:MAG TPA: nuclear transport factor 2 family protein [Saprospiraceae bacterium]|nr:nuclear transport factor 2 family protein [Saprospiraceae bacterium]HNL38850.1 nuclear transport factor 2 family protein [Saprospiraceae bacterium]HNM25854.1 nuclear transport factor 2 family protein [Saprospiraceae bacterium]
MKQLLFLLLAGGTAFAQPLRAQQSAPQLTDTILHLDSLFWSAYNRCDVDQMARFFTDDVEFYHDKGGLTTGLANFETALRNGLCGNPDFHLRREAVPGTVQVFPLSNQDGIYGAILMGEHVFYIREHNKPEFLDGHARFTHVWLLRNGAWKMARILSYDHGPAQPPRRE